jgi:hypothetical protein
MRARVGEIGKGNKNALAQFWDDVKKAEAPFVERAESKAGRRARDDRRDVTARDYSLRRGAPASRRNNSRLRSIPQ